MSNTILNNDHTRVPQIVGYAGYQNVVAADQPSVAEDLELAQAKESGFLFLPGKREVFNRHRDYEFPERAPDLPARDRDLIDRWRTHCLREQEPFVLVVSFPAKHRQGFSGGCIYLDSRTANRWIINGDGLGDAFVSRNLTFKGLYKAWFSVGFGQTFGKPNAYGVGDKCHAMRIGLQRGDAFEYGRRLTNCSFIRLAHDPRFSHWRRVQSTSNASNPAVLVQ